MPKSRLRPAPENVKPYAYDAKTSIGPGPPTQIVVTKYNPLIPFNKVTAIFATFGEIAESSNKMHPETGSYLGFATIRYRDSKRSDRQTTSGFDAARRAVRARGIKVEADMVKVEYDPEGRRSRQMLENHLKKEKQRFNKDTHHASPTGPSGPPTGPKLTTALGFTRPPPTAPKGPAAHRQPTPALASAAHTPASHRSKSGPENQLIVSHLPPEPYIFINSESVPVLVSIVPHMKKRLKNYGIEDIRLDKRGYYLLFRNSTTGKTEAERCHRTVNHTEFFNYDMDMQLCLPRSANQSNVPRNPSASPTRVRRVARHRDDEAERRRREVEGDLEEEKRQRAKHFDPVLEAVNVVRREMTEHLIRHIRTQVAAPALVQYLDPANHVAKRRRLNIDHPDDMLDDEDSNIFSVGTPNSRVDPIERRTANFDVTSLPRIRKIRNASTKRTVSQAVTLKKRPGLARPAIRSLHHRLKTLDSDTESEDDVDRDLLVVRDAEELESHLPSHPTSDDELSKGDNSSWEMQDDETYPGPELMRNKHTLAKRKLEALSQMDSKRQKQSDHGLYGSRNNSVDPNQKPLDDSDWTGVEVEAPDEPDSNASRSATPASQSGLRALAKGARGRKLSAKHEVDAFEESRDRLDDETLEKDPATSGLEDTSSLTLVENYTEAVDESMFSTEPLTAALKLPDGFKPDIATLRTMILGHDDGPNLLKLQKKYSLAHMQNPELWLWQRWRVRHLNSYGGTLEEPVSIESYYVPNPTGCARTEGVKKILNSEKSKYLPHHLKVKKQREEREESFRTNGKDAATEATKLAAERILSKGNSRANRATNRRFLADLNDQKKSLGQDSDVFKFNQLKKRKKPVKFARSAIHNWGLYAMENIAKDDMIIEYVGEEVRQQISEIRENRYLKSGIGSSYLFRIDDNTVVDATKKGGIARFINHSCMPNCTAKIIKVEGSKRIVIYALRDIAMSKS